MTYITLKIKNNKFFKLSPTRIIFFSFMGLIFIGGLLLNLPIASKSNTSIGMLNALFTATSATCVTGLVVADTATQWTLFGQIVILSLIQIGGLGIVTLATFFSVILGKKVGLKGMILAQESLNQISFEGVLRLLKRVVLISFGIELIGSILLSIVFVPEYGPRGVYMGIFHSISAFCNAGFDIIGDYKSFANYNNNPILIYTICGLVIIGGLGFMVWKDIYEYKKTRQLLLHSKVVLFLTGILIVFGAVFFLFAEYQNTATIGNFSIFEKINASIFHSINTRTAGFSTLALGDLNEISKVATVLLMFIGGAPGSTAGGIKITTFGVVLIAVWSQIRGDNDTIIFKKKVPNYIVLKSLSIIVLGMIVVVIITTILLADESNLFLNVLLESASAFGTVGLSTGITPSLHTISKIFLIITMFWGRIGPLSFAIALTLKRNKKSDDIIYPDGKIVVG